MTIWVTLLRRRSRSTASDDVVAGQRRRVEPPSCSASFIASLTRGRAAAVAGRRRFGRSTWATVQGASIIVGQAPAGAHQVVGHGVAADQHQDALARRPGPVDAGAAHGADQLVVDGLGGAAQRHLAQRGQVLRLEEVVRGQARGLGHIDLALGQALAQLVRA